MGIVDRFWLWRRFGLPALAVLLAAVLTLWVVVISAIPDRMIGACVATVGGMAAGVWFAVFVRGHQRPRMPP